MARCRDTVMQTLGLCHRRFWGYRTTLAVYCSGIPDALLSLLLLLLQELLVVLHGTAACIYRSGGAVALVSRSTRRLGR